jgi:hypothetical protein
MIPDWASDDYTGARFPGLAKFHFPFYVLLALVDLFWVVPQNENTDFAANNSFRDLLAEQHTHHI